MKIMRNLVPDLLPLLETHCLEGLNLGPGSIAPYYDGCSLVNIPASICHWLGVPGFGAPPLKEEILNLHPQNYKHVILLVVDGLGLNTLEDTLRRSQSDSNLAVWGEMADEGALAPLTSTVPSTTATALASFWTGRPSAEHGVVGFEVWLKEYGMIANMIYHNPASFNGDIGSLYKAGFNPETFLPVPTLGPHLVRNSVRPYAFQHHSIANSGLSTMMLPGVKSYPFRSLRNCWVGVGDLLDTRPDESNYIYVYWGDLDDHSHRFGPEDPRVALELASFSRQLGVFLQDQRKKARQGDTLLLITADHGHIPTPRRIEYELRNHPDLMDCLVMMPSGEARLPYAYLRPGREADFMNYLEKTWSGQFKSAPSERAIQAGLFGARGIYEKLPDRVGDFVVFPQKGAYWWFGSRDNPLLGRHGGVSRTEMLIPLLSVEL
jgi:hypothetical protein